MRAAFFGVIAAAGGALQHLQPRGREGLAHLLGQQGGQLVALILQNAGELAHAQRAVFERYLAVGAKGRMGDGDLGFDGFGSQGFKAAKEFAGSGIDRLNGHGC